MTNKSESGQDSFSEKMIRILNDGALNLALAIGYRTGLLDAMDGLEIPQTVDHLAQKTGLNLRYIQEWLAVMVSGEIVEVNYELESDATLINQDCYGEGWIITINPSNWDEDSQELLQGAAAAKWLEEEIEKVEKGKAEGKDYAAD